MSLFIRRLNRKLLELEDEELDNEEGLRPLVHALEAGVSGAQGRALFWQDYQDKVDARRAAVIMAYRAGGEARAGLSEEERSYAEHAHSRVTFTDEQLAAKVPDNKEFVFLSQLPSKDAQEVDSFARSCGISQERLKKLEDDGLFSRLSEREEQFLRSLEAHLRNSKAADASLSEALAAADMTEVELSRLEVKGYLFRPTSGEEVFLKDLARSPECRDRLALEKMAASVGIERKRLSSMLSHERIKLLTKDEQRLLEHLSEKRSDTATLPELAKKHRLSLYRAVELQMRWEAAQKHDPALAFAPEIQSGISVRRTNIQVHYKEPLGVSVSRLGRDEAVPPTSFFQEPVTTSLSKRQKPLLRHSVPTNSAA